MSKHVPGPWIVIPQRGSGEGSYEIGREADREDMFMKTFIHILGPSDFIPMEYAEYIEGNANLVAAAPDLLAACEKALEELIHLTGHHPIWLKKAIAKAKGEQWER